MYEVIVKNNGKVIRVRHFSTKKKAEEYELAQYQYNPVAMSQGIRAKGRLVTCPFCECDTEINVTQ